MFPLDAKRLDNVFELKVNDIGRDAKTENESHNPDRILQKVLNSEISGRNFRFFGVKDPAEKLLVGGK